VANYYKTVMTLNTSSWDPFNPPFNANVIVVNNNTDNDVKLRTISGDPSTEETIQSRFQKKIGDTGPKYRFPAGAAAFYLQASTGAPTVNVECWD
jgi:hypothetical protein